MGERCPICGSPMAPFAAATVLRRHEVSYFQCTSCRFVRTEDPYWLEDAYSTALAKADVGAVERNLRLAEATQAVIQSFFPSARRFLDFGGGYGLFVRLMRDRGFDFLWQDKHARPLFCLGFEAEPGERGFDLVTAFEVLEHVVEPIPTFAELLAKSNAVLFSTELLPATNPKPGDWWYFAPSQGQHVSIFTREALEAAASSLGVRLASAGSLHLFSRKGVSEARFQFVVRPRVARLLARVRRRTSLIGRDFERITGERLR